MTPQTSTSPLDVDAFYRPVFLTECLLPLFHMIEPTDFPSPAEDYIEGKLDLSQYLIEHPAATLFVRVSGHSMLGAGIHSGDLLVVDRALEPRSGSIVIAVLDGELLVKRLQQSEEASLAVFGA